MPAVDIVIPVLNEAHVLDKTVHTVRAFAREHLRARWQVVVVDNGSTDGTQEVAKKLAAQHPGEVSFLHLVQRGRGRALRTAWLQSKADAMCYMDVDLSTDLRHLPELIGSVLYEVYDVATGSRLQPDSQTTRSLKREFVSRGYNLIVKAVLNTKFSDAQCGFKAISRAAAEKLVPQIEDQGWFFDTELLVLAEKQGYRIRDLPVRWIEDDDSRVKIIRTGLDDLKGVWRLRRMLWKSKPASVGVPRSKAAVMPPAAQD